MLFTSHAMKENILVFCDSEIILRPHTIKVLRKGALAFPTAENCTLACFVFFKVDDSCTICPCDFSFMEYITVRLEVDNLNSEQLNGKSTLPPLGQMRIAHKIEFYCRSYYS